MWAIYIINSVDKSNFLFYHINYVVKVGMLILPRGQDLQSEGWVPGALSNGTNEPVGQSLQLVPTWPTSSE